LQQYAVFFEQTRGHTMAAMLTGQKLRAIRALRGLSQIELAEMAGISPTSLATFESGKSDMRASTIVKLCDALGVTVTYHVGDTSIGGP
jgi:transcriptional regulator with XRE-family HTH domain